MKVRNKNTRILYPSGRKILNSQNKLKPFHAFQKINCFKPLLKLWNWPTCIVSGVRVSCVRVCSVSTAGGSHCRTAAMPPPAAPPVTTLTVTMRNSLYLPTSTLSCKLSSLHLSSSPCCVLCLLRKLSFRQTADCSALICALVTRVLCCVAFCV